MGVGNYEEDAKREQVSAGKGGNTAPCANQPQGWDVQGWEQQDAAQENHKRSDKGEMEKMQQQFPSSSRLFASCQSNTHTIVITRKEVQHQIKGRITSDPETNKKKRPTIHSRMIFFAVMDVAQ